MHLDWPLMPDAAVIRNLQLPALGQELAACKGPCVVVGDLNTTPWSSHYRDLLNVSGFRDCAAGRGFLPTWHAGLPVPLRIRIDHCLVNSTVSVVAVEVGASAGSDHLATINDLLVARDTQSN
jgi:endonuclease/exonuclease/phosphatase (EEP) superfamily protein YafD